MTKTWLSLIHHSFSTLTLSSILPMFFLFQFLLQHNPFHVSDTVWLLQVHTKFFEILYMPMHTKYNYVSHLAINAHVFFWGEHFRMFLSSFSKMPNNLSAGKNECHRTGNNIHISFIESGDLFKSQHKSAWTTWAFLLCHAHPLQKNFRVWHFPIKIIVA